MNTGTFVASLIMAAVVAVLIAFLIRQSDYAGRAFTHHPGDVAPRQ